MTNYSDHPIQLASDILNAICHNLDSAESAYDPYPIEAEYLEYCLEGTHGLISREEDGGWMFSTPSLKQALQIIRTHTQESDE